MDTYKRQTPQISKVHINKASVGGGRQRDQHGFDVIKSFVPTVQLTNKQLIFASMPEFCLA